ncbi:MAG: iron ABC transporter permease, partial [Pseudomonadota bacterium]|nr:iron ABC transporter permease [Pseudomonadota bacterium]
MNGARTLSSRTSRRRPLWALLLVGVLALLLAVSVGSVALSPLELWQTLLGHGSPLHHTLVWELRLPRALAAFGTGALLALAGALMQVLLRNPLADPYVLGLSGGASVAALGAMLAGLGAALVSLSAFGGALISILLVFGLAHGSGSWSPARLLLTGVVMASGWGAIITFLLAVSPVEELPGMLYWLMGDMAYARSPWPVLVVAALAGAVLVPLGRTLNVLARGGQQALALGVAVRPLEWGLYLGASLATATAVT